EVVVGVLQRGLLAIEDVPVAERRQDRGDHGLADVAATTPAVCGDQLGEGPDAAHPDQVEQLLPAVVEVLAQRPGLLHAGLGEQLLEQRYARAAGGTGPGAGFDPRDVRAALVPDRAQ